MEHKTIETQRGQISYWVDGNRMRPRLMFLHGALMDHRMFYQQVTYFREHYLILIPDLPAHGRSRPYEHFSFSNTVEDLMQILDQEKVRHCHMLGHSMGGYIAQEFYRQAPGIIKSMTCMSSAPIGGKYYSNFDQWLLRITPTLLRFYTMNRLIQDIVKRDTLTPSSAQYTRDTLRQYSKEEVIHIMETIAQDLRFEEELKMDCPLLIMVGDSDAAGKVHSSSRQWAQDSGGELRSVPLAAHMLNVDNPGSFNLILDQWLKSIK